MTCAPRVGAEPLPDKDNGSSVTLAAQAPLVEAPIERVGRVKCEPHGIVRCAVCMGTAEPYVAPVPTGTERVPRSTDAAEVEYLLAHPRPKGRRRVPSHPMYAATYPTLRHRGSSPTVERKRWLRNARTMPAPTPEPQSSALPRARTNETMEAWAERLGVKL